MGDSNSEKVISFHDFCNSELNSLTWYDYLPGDGLNVTHIPQDPSVVELIGRLLSSEPSPNDIDLLAAKILSDENYNIPLVELESLSFHLSQLMSKNLTASGSRILRMKSQRLVYYIQALIDKPRNNPGKNLIIEESFCEGLKPWDHFTNGIENWWISSGQPNIHCSSPSGQRKITRGLPTQIDSLKTGEIVFGSIYTPGATLFHNGKFEELVHEFPVVLVFDYEGSRYSLDHFSTIWSLNKEKVLKAPCTQTHFARFFSPFLYLMDNGDFGKISRVDMRTLKSERIEVLPVQVCNDLVMCNNFFYLIDKQQGSVFKFSDDWKFQSRVLKFGKDYGCLQDPVSIRAHNNDLYIVSWLTAKLTRMKVF